MKTITENEAYELFCEYIDEVTDEIIIGEVTIQPSRALYHTDPIAYRQGFLDWLDGQEDFEVEGY